MRSNLRPQEYMAFSVNNLKLEGRNTA